MLKLLPDAYINKYPFDNQMILRMRSSDYKVINLKYKLMVSVYSLYSQTC